MAMVVRDDSDVGEHPKDEAEMAARSVEVVTAHGEVVKASPDTNEDLFWAARSGGGNFGVVTSFEFELYDVGPLVQGLGIFYPHDAAKDVFETHREVLADAPKN